MNTLKCLKSKMKNRDKELEERKMKVVKVINANLSIPHTSHNQRSDDFILKSLEREINTSLSPHRNYKPKVNYDKISSQINTINKSQIMFRSKQAVVEREADKRFMNLLKSQEKELDIFNKSVMYIRKQANLRNAQDLIVQIKSNERSKKKLIYKTKREARKSVENDSKQMYSNTYDLII